MITYSFSFYRMVSTSDERMGGEEGAKKYISIRSQIINRQISKNNI